VQISLLVFWFSLNVAGIKKGIWQVTNSAISHHDMMKSLMPWFHTFTYSGLILLLSLAFLSITILYHYLKDIANKKES
jgi:hypothetical protein